MTGCKPTLKINAYDLYKNFRDENKNKTKIELKEKENVEIFFDQTSLKEMKVKRFF